jgi:hypothetical protein
MSLPGLPPGNQPRGAGSVQLCRPGGVKELTQHCVRDISGRANPAVITRSPNSCSEIEYFSVLRHDNVSDDC